MDYHNFKKLSLSVTEFVTQCKIMAYMLIYVGHDITERDLVIKILDGLPSKHMVSGFHHLYLHSWKHDLCCWLCCANWQCFLGKLLCALPWHFLLSPTHLHLTTFTLVEEILAARITGVGKTTSATMRLFLKVICSQFLELHQSLLHMIIVIHYPNSASTIVRHHYRLPNHYADGLYHGQKALAARQV